MWSVVADITVEDTGAPFLLSRNFEYPHLLDGFSDKEKFKISTNHKEEKVLYALFIAGQVLRIDQNKHFRWQLINPTRLNNVILHPGDPLERVE